jgi:small GTP-binding protein
MGESMLIETTTSAIDFMAKTFQLSDGSVVNCFIYDTCGQERYKAINESYYRKADAALLVYDISEKKSFDVIRDYYCPKIKQFCKKDIPILLLGNKIDREQFRQIKTEEGIELASKEKYRFKETSCLKNENVADAFEALIEMWNIENQKKTIFERNRRNSNYTQNNKKQESINRAKTFNAKYIIGLEDNKKIKLDKKKHNKKNKKSK